MKTLFFPEILKENVQGNVGNQSVLIKSNILNILRNSRPTYVEKAPKMGKMSNFQEFVIDGQLRIGYSYGQRQTVTPKSGKQVFLNIRNLKKYFLLPLWSRC